MLKVFFLLLHQECVTANVVSVKTVQFFDIRQLLGITATSKTQSSLEKIFTRDNVTKDNSLNAFIKSCSIKCIFSSFPWKELQNIICFVIYKDI